MYLEYLTCNRTRASHLVSAQAETEVPYLTYLTFAPLYCTVQCKDHQPIIIPTQTTHRRLPPSNSLTPHNDDTRFATYIALPCLAFSDATSAVWLISPTSKQSTSPPKMPSATGQNWEKYKKEFADDEEPEKKITPLTDEYDDTMELLSSDRLRLTLTDGC